MEIDRIGVIVFFAVSTALLLLLFLSRNYFNVAVM